MPILKSQTPVSCKAVLDMTLKEMGTLKRQSCFWPFSSEPYAWGDAGPDCPETSWVPLLLQGVVEKQHCYSMMCVRQASSTPEHAVCAEIGCTWGTFWKIQYKCSTHLRHFLDCTFLAPLLHLEKQQTENVTWSFWLGFSWGTNQYHWGWCGLA